MASRPEFFRLLFILVPITAVMMWNYVNGRKSLVEAAGVWRPRSFYELYTVKSFFSSLGMIIFIIFAVLSLAGFPGKEVPVSYEPAGTDIIFAVDISNSMKAQDASTSLDVSSRLDSAARVIRSVCDNTPDGRFGVVVFKGRGIKIIPATEDVETIYSFLNFLSTDLMTSPGSSIQAGVETALTAFPEAEERKKYIILITDGEALSGNLDSIISGALEKDVAIYSIGTGSAEGAEIPSADGPLRDSAGDVVITKLDERSLRFIAEGTGGEYFHSTDSSVLPELISLAAGTVDENESGYKIIIKENYRMFLVIALFGLLIAKFVKVFKWKNYF